MHIVLGKAQGDSLPPNARNIHVVPAQLLPQVAYDGAGAPTPALLGFCKKNGVTGGLACAWLVWLGALWQDGPGCVPLALHSLACRCRAGLLHGSCAGQLNARHADARAALVLSIPAVEDCFAEADAKGVEYVWAEVKQVGRSAAEVRWFCCFVAGNGLWQWGCSVVWRCWAWYQGGCLAPGQGRAAKAAVCLVVTAGADGGAARPGGQPELQEEHALAARCRQEGKGVGSGCTSWVLDRYPKSMRWRRDAGTDAVGGVG